MKIICVYTHLHSATSAWLDAHPEVERVYTGVSEYDYYRFCCVRWMIPRPFMLIEHDVVPPDLSEIIACPEPWCTHPYRINGTLVTTGFGCVKFSALLIADFPAIFDRFVDKTWRRLDTQFHQIVGETRAVHTHLPHAQHVRDYGYSKGH